MLGVVIQRVTGYSFLLLFRLLNRRLLLLTPGVLYNGQPSIRLDRYVSPSENTAREVNGSGVDVSPGDHIVFSCWMKTTPSGSGYNGAAGYGARIRSLLIYDGKFISDIQYTGSYTRNPTLSTNCDNYVPWNTGYLDFKNT